MHHDALGDLEHQLLGIEPGAFQVAGEVGHEVGLADGIRGEVDMRGDRVGRKDPRVQLLNSGAGFLQDHAVDLGLEARLFGEGHEGEGGDHPPLRVVPADQRLESVHSQILEIQQRLEIHVEPVVLDGVPKLVLEIETTECGRMHRLLEDRHLALAALLGCVQSGERVAHELLGAPVARWLESDADTGREPHLPVLERKRLRQITQNTLCSQFGLIRIRCFEQNCKLVGAEVGHRITRADAHSEAFREGDQDLVSRRVAEAVVDPLEIIEVEEQKNDRVPRGPAAGEGVADAVEQQRAVRKAGEGVVQRLVVGWVGELALCLVSLYVGDGGTGLLAETAHRAQVALRILAIRFRVDVEDPYEIPVARQGNAQRAGWAVLFVIVAVVAPVKCAVY